MRQMLFPLIAAALASPAGAVLAAPAPGHAVAAAQPSDPCSAAVDADLSALPLGCATERNLRLMVADPRDLTRGAPPATASGDPAFAAIERYRLGQVKPLGETQDTAAAAAGAPSSPQVR